MAYCQKCGKLLNDDDLFCSKCGNPVGNNLKNTGKNLHISENQTRKTVYDGTIHKCPNCGETLGSFIMICPSCGYELRDKHIHPSLQKFINDISQLDFAIASQRESVSIDVVSFILIIVYAISTLMFCFYPIIILPIVIWAFCFFTSFSTIREKNKEAYIKNYTFPNDRESLLHGLFFVKSKIDYLASNKLTSKSIHWIRIWTSKAEQLYQLSSIIINNDEITKNIYNSIIVAKTKAISSYRKKMLVSCLICIGLSVLILVIFIIMHYNALKYLRNI